MKKRSELVDIYPSQPYENLMSKTVQDFLPIKSKKNTMIQGRVPTELIDQAKKLMKDKNLSWSELLTALIKHWLVENPKK